MPLETDPQASSAGKKPPTLLAAALLGGIWLLDIFAT